LKISPFLKKKEKKKRKKVLIMKALWKEKSKIQQNLYNPKNPKP
jgi:hypothetical protein